MEDPETLATLGTHDTGRRLKQKTSKQTNNKTKQTKQKKKNTNKKKKINIKKKNSVGFPSRSANTSAYCISSCLNSPASSSVKHSLPRRYILVIY